MKVTVCFGTVRVIVPCGNGEILVSQLTEKAITRYKKAIGRSSDYWLIVHNLKSHSDGGILDPDDLLVDVADDREQIIAHYEEQDGPRLHPNGGDGTSASSVGTSSPDMFNSAEATNQYNNKHIGNDVIITPSDLAAGPAPNLIVRRGSEPSLNTISSPPPLPSSQPPALASNKKRWSSIAQLDKLDHDCDLDKQLMPPPLAPPPHRAKNGVGPPSLGQAGTTAFSRFARDSTRQSLANTESTYKWLEAQQRQEENYQYSDIRKEPVGGTGYTDDYITPLSNDDEVIVIKNTTGPLGIHVVPDYDNSGRDVGLLVQGIETDGRIHRDGRLKVNDRITQINGTDLLDVNFAKAQELFKQALQTDEIRLKVTKSTTRGGAGGAPPPVFPKPSTAHLRQKSDSALPSPTKSAGSGQSMSPMGGQKRTGLFSPPLSLVKTVNKADVVSLSPTKKTPPAVPTRHPSTTLSSSSLPKPASDASDAAAATTDSNGAGAGGGVNSGTLTKDNKANRITAANTRKIGQKINIDLVKESLGLGFSITTRDNVPGGKSPIYIKNILPKGAAIADGRLTSGDRLLEVNGVEMTGLSQSDAVAILRSTKLGSVVHLVVSRQVDTTMSTPTPGGATTGTGSVAPTGTPAVQDDRDKTPERVTTTRMSVYQEKYSDIIASGKEILDLHIVLNEAGSTGLGVSVKGKTSTNMDRGPTDLGIFIKTIIPGGAAAEDGRLCVNDQLVEVNDDSLRGLSNTDAMEKLRVAMKRSPEAPSYIDLVVARRKDNLLYEHSPNPHTPHEIRELRVSASEPPEDLPPSPYTPHTPGLLGLGVGAGNSSGGSSSERPASTSGTSDASDQTVIHRPPPPPSSRTSSGAASSRGQAASKGNHGNSSSSSAGSVSASASAQNKLMAQRLAMINSASTMRNDSYMRATHESMSESVLTANGAVVGAGVRVPGAAGTGATGDHDQYIRLRSGLGSSCKPRPSSMSDILDGPAPDDAPDVSIIRPVSNEAPDWLNDCITSGQDNTRNSVVSDSLDEDGPGFQREGFGRQSMSEKRRGHLDPRNTAFYQNMKKGKNLYSSGSNIAGGELRRAGSVESVINQSQQRISLHDLDSSTRNELGPTLGLKKSSSLESLQTAVQEATMDEDTPGGGAPGGRQPNRGMVRGRGCNDSFRAAVDRSYEQNMDPDLEPLNEESSDAGSAVARSAAGSEGGLNTSDGSSASAVAAAVAAAAGGRIATGAGSGSGTAHTPGKVIGVPAVAKMSPLPPASLRSQLPSPPQPPSHTPRHNGAATATNAINGTATRPAPNATPAAAAAPPSQRPDRPGSVAEALASDHLEINGKLVKKKSRKEKDKNSLFKGLGSMFRFGKHRDMVQSEEKPQSVREHLPPSGQPSQQPHKSSYRENRLPLDDRIIIASSTKPPPPTPRDRGVVRSESRGDNNNVPSSASKYPEDYTRAEKINALRAEHQRRHRERQGRYPHESETDDVQDPVYNDYRPPPRTRQLYDGGVLADRPGSRKAYIDASHYSHYANYNEIQAHIRHHEANQQRYKQLTHTATPQSRGIGMAFNTPQVTPMHGANPYAIDPNRYTVQDSAAASSETRARLYAHQQKLQRQQEQAYVRQTSSASKLPYTQRSQSPSHHTHTPAPRNQQYPPTPAVGQSDPYRSGKYAPSSTGGYRSQPSSMTYLQSALQPYTGAGHPHGSVGGAYPDMYPPSGAGGMGGRSVSASSSRPDPSVAFASNQPMYGSLPRTTRSQKRAMISGAAQV